MSVSVLIEDPGTVYVSCSIPSAGDLALTIYDARDLLDQLAEALEMVPVSVESEEE